MAVMNEQEGVPYSSPQQTRMGSEPTFQSQQSSMSQQQPTAKVMMGFPAPASTQIKRDMMNQQSTAANLMKSQPIVGIAQQVPMQQAIQQRTHLMMQTQQQQFPLPQ